MIREPARQFVFSWRASISSAKQSTKPPRRSTHEVLSPNRRLTVQRDLCLVKTSSDKTAISRLTKPIPIGGFWEFRPGWHFEEGRFCGRESVYSVHCAWGCRKSRARICLTLPGKSLVLSLPTRTAPHHLVLPARPRRWSLNSLPFRPSSWSALWSPEQKPCIGAKGRGVRCGERTA